MKQIKWIIGIGILLIGLVCGCVQLYPNQEDLANADYGQPPKNYEPAIKEAFQEMLFDPYSAHYEFKQPEKSWVRLQTKFGAKSEFNYCWRVPVKVNAKNRFGAYVGWKPYYFYYKNGCFVTFRESYQ